MKSEDLARLRARLALMDEAALTGLANKGLYRRAVKDVDKGGITHLEDAEQVVISGPGWTVYMPPSGPEQATDDSPASGVTRHILTAVLYLQANLSDSETPVSTQVELDEGFGARLRERLLAIPLQTLDTWAGKRRLNEAARQAEAPTEVELGARLVVRWPDADVEVLGHPGVETERPKALLDGLTSTCPRLVRRAWIAAAVLVLKRRAGQPVHLKAPALQESSGSAKRRPEVLAEVQHLTVTMAGTGLAHPSTRTVERLATLEQTALGVDLPRLARELRALSDEVLRLLERHALADVRRVFAQTASLHALAEALERAGETAPVALVGRHRSRYLSRGPLGVHGVGAYRWRTASGYFGLTAVFWAPAERRFLTWSESRPVDTPQPFDPAAIYAHRGLWSAGGVSTVCTSQLQFADARANEDGRLSAAPAVQAELRGPTSPLELSFGPRDFDDWDALWAHAATLTPTGLAQTNPLDALVVLRPAEWGPRHFDEISGRFAWLLLDANGAVIPIGLPWSPDTNAAITFLERIDPTRHHLRAVLGRWRDDHLSPIAVFTEAADENRRVLSVDFDPPVEPGPQSRLLQALREKYGRDRVQTTMLDPESSPPATLPAGLGRLLDETGAAVLRAAERGGGVDDSSRGRLTEALTQVGLTLLAQRMRQAVDARGVLRAAYTLGVYRVSAARVQA